MMYECYELISDEIQMRKFVDMLLPNDRGQYYITLFARKKYDTTGILKCDKNCLKRVMSQKEHIISKIRQLEIKKGFYFYEGKPVPQECLALYITPNERCFKTARLQLLKELVDQVEKNNVHNPYSSAMNVLQTSSKNRKYFDMDIDFLKPEDFEEYKNHISKYINLDACTFIQTRGGYHCLINMWAVKDKYTNLWHNGFTKNKFKDVQVMANSDGLIPMVGGYQGGFVPKLV